MSDERGGMSAEGTEVTTETEEPKWWERAADWLEGRELTANGSQLTAGEEPRGTERKKLDARCEMRDVRCQE